MTGQIEKVTEPSEAEDLSAAETVLADLMYFEPGELMRLTQRLTKDAQRSGVLDIAYRTVDSPVGNLLLAATPRGLVRVAFEREDFDSVLKALAAKLSPRILPGDRRLDDAAHQVEEYFAGKRQYFDLTLDYSLSHGFRQLVQRHLPEITYGHTSSYKELAALVGKPTAIRAVGTACATNPLPVVVPCHRVLRSDGSLGGYLGGLPAKEWLLELERSA